ncbi:hypothetical protein VTJ49DRAFT_6185 [Mycothermus thermophilus]|uniref:FAD dependent oxidoreductase domain-containing protein n=1 Tax=Humicola insolens TaxID=85995 RepID=A0ABR3VJF9_HUMIN
MGIESGIVTSPPSGLPSRDPTKSYWLRDPNPTLLGHRGTPDLPAEADVVVVGSGITGAFAARFLVEGSWSENLSVVMLEAREVCWGATGRNGGHCQPLVYAATPTVAAFELEVYDFMERLVRDEAINCDWVSLTGVHAFLSKDIFDSAAAAAEQLAQSHPELAANLQVIRRDDPSSTEEKQQRTLASLRIPTAHGAIIQQKAASLWPYKLVASILERLVAAHPPPRFNLQTNTPATSLARADDGSGRWTLTTPRGTITARQVLLATNGYTSHLLPAFADLIVPMRGQVASLLPPLGPSPPQGGETAPVLKHSYVFAADPEPAPESAAAAPRDDYLIQRPLPTGELIYGGGRRLARALGVGEWRDDIVEEDVARYLRRNLCPPLDLSTPPTDGGNDGHQPEEENLELDATHEWTGIMGYSRDRHAWVGAVPEALGGGDGLFICAGYTGHGMPAAALSAKAVVGQMRRAWRSWKGGEEEERDAETDQEMPEIPAEFILSEERVVRARGMPHVTGGWEATVFAELVGA